jgi:hypothetical protein
VIISGGTDATIRVWEAATGDPVGCPVHLPANKPFNVGLAVKDTSVAIYFGGEVAMFGCAGESSLTIGEPTEIPLLRVSHVINWFPGGLLADDPDADHWGLHSVEEWQRSGPAAEPKSGLAAPIDVSPARLARWAAGLLDKAGLDVVELEHGFYGVSLTEDFADGHEFPAFFVITHARPFPTTQEKTQ